MILSRFRPSLGLTLSALVVLAITLKLAFWQFDRAAEKHQLETAAIAGLQGDLVTIRANIPIQPFQRAALVGHYLPSREILLDNRIDQQRLGYHVITPLMLADGDAVMVNRGWIAATNRRSTLPATPTLASRQVTVRGIFYTDEANAFILSTVSESGVLRQRLHLAEYAEETGLVLLSLVLIQESDADNPLTPVPILVDFKSTRSTAYAWQWLTFSLLTIIFYGILGRRQR